MAFILITLFFIIFFRFAIKHKFLKNEEHIEYYKRNWEEYDLSDKPFEKKYRRFLFLEKAMMIGIIFIYAVYVFFTLLFWGIL
jgi:hypothetical protein